MRTAPASVRRPIILPTLEELEALSVDELAALGVELAALQVHVANRLRRTPKVEPETLLTAKEVAEILRTSEDWVRHRPELPFRVRTGPGQIRYSPSALARWQRDQAEGSG
jgi:hypothetical protein